MQRDLYKRVAIWLIYYGHTKEDPVTKEVLSQQHWQLLKVHLNEVANLAEERGAKFGAGKLGRILGLAHDLGKYSCEFQKRLEGKPGKVDHSTAGAQEVYRRFGGMVGRALAFTILGHHGGLPDGNKGSPANAPERLGKTDIPNYHTFSAEVDIPQLTNQDLKGMPSARVPEMAAFSFSFCIRMLYSCLVDADYLDTEHFMNIDKFRNRPEPVPMKTLLEKIEKKMETLAERNRQNHSLINTARQEILARCWATADTNPGFFTLTVPTGGGKTYSSLAFALKHAAKHDKDRVIYVAPYTSIIEQNAQVFRDVLEEGLQGNVVLEHQSNFEYPEGNFDEWNVQAKTHRLASENWDMPVIVTTAVQFFESLYANKSSRCRKLHNMTNSVIILDEAQMIPLESMKPCLWALTELVLNYGVTAVLCTATQPAINGLLPGNMKPFEIMENPTELQKIFKRVKVSYGDSMSDEELADAMVQETQVLAIVNTRRHAKLLFDRLAEKSSDGVYHLSARMCPAHRKQVLAVIRQALYDGKACRVVSTQLIEAGVDVDFPVVYRSAAGIDSIAQAAGRCNREGRLNEGRVVVFDPEPHGMPKRGRFSAAAGLTRSVARHLQQFGGELLSLEAIEAYFHQLLDLERDNLDAKGILKMIKDGGDGLAFPFAEIAREFQLIDDITVPVVVPWDEQAKKLMVEAEHHPFPASKVRRLQPYVVQIYQYEFVALQKEGVIKSVGDVMNFITDSSFYDKMFGLNNAKEVQAPTDVLIF